MEKEKVTVYTVFKDISVTLASEKMEWTDVRQGIKRHLIAFGQNMTMALYRADKTSLLPEHNHPQELVSVLLKGEVEVVFNGKKHNLKPGMGYHIPPNAIHGPFVTTSDEPALYLDILSPPREKEVYEKK